MLKAIKTNIKDIPSPKALKPEQKLFDFWKEKVAGNPEDGFTHAGFSIDKIKFIQCLLDLGFRRFDIDNTHIFIQVVNFRVIRQVSKIKMQDYFFSELNKHYGIKPISKTGIHVEELVNYIYNRMNNLFNEELLYRLIVPEPIQFNVDRAHIKFMYFRNGFLEITKDKIDFKDYKHLYGFVWENEILARDYKPADSREAFFSLFIKRICSVKQNNQYEYTEQRVNSLRAIIGYNLHTYTNTKLKATLFTDSRISNDDEPNGRTGKTLLCKALGRIVCPDPDNTASTTWCEINGKDFDPRNKNKYQTANIDTKIIILNDLRKGFDFEILFNDITEGLTVERKNQHPFKIRPRILATTNKTIKLEGSSSKDRAIEFEFGDYFNEDRSPQDEYGHWFFTDWRDDEWNRFDTYMAQCCKIYLANGLMSVASINLNERKMRDNTSLEFIEWFDSSEVKDLIRMAIRNDEFCNKGDLYNDFVAQYPDFTKLTRKRFSGWIDYYCKYNSNGLTIEERKHMGKQGHGIKFKITK